LETKGSIIQKQPIKDRSKKQPISWHKNWIPILISVLALIATIYSLYRTGVQYKRSIRPFVYACNFRAKVSEGNNVIEMPNMIAVRVHNAPARIQQLDIKIILNENAIFHLTKKNLLIYPDESADWNWDIKKDIFEWIMNRSDSEKSKLIRKVTIDYSSLDGYKKYYFKMEQSFLIDQNQWGIISEDAN
jgi:hypothetical protein